MSARPKLARLGPRSISFISAALGLCLLFVFAAAGSPPPTVDLAFGEHTIYIRADRAWTWHPGDCVTVEWRLEGIESLYVDGAGKIGADEMRYCPDINLTGPQFEARAQNGVYRSVRLEIQHLPDLLFYLAGFVILAGSPLLALYYFFARSLERPLPLYWLLWGGLILAALGGWLRLQDHEAPLIDVDDGGMALRIWAEHDRLLFPHECVTVWWSVVGAEGIRFNGRDVTAGGNPASGEHCAEDGAKARIEVFDESGAGRLYALPISALFPQSGVPPPFTYVSLLGIFLGLVVYAPLLAQSLREHWRKSARTDGLAIGGCFLVVAVLYLPFGFDSSGQWEEWIIHGYTEGGTLSFYVTEAVSRPFVMIPHTLAYLISSESFVGYHVVSFLQYAGRMALLYVILRQVGVSPLYAFLTAILFMVYPVNDNLMSLRRLPKNFSVLTLLLAAALFLDYRKNPRRLALLGVWLGLLFSVNSNETGYAVILVAPLLFWLRDRRLSPRNLNLSAIWFIVPAFKLASVMLLIATGRDFYQSGLLSAPGQETTSWSTALETLGIVFPQTFVHGWGDALAALSATEWLTPAFIILAAIGLIAAYCVSQSGDEPAPTPRQIGWALASGLVLVMAAVGVLMWLPLYRSDPWRMYLLAPIGASVAVFSLILLLASPIRDALWRNVAVVGLSLLLLLPATSRLIIQFAGFEHSAEQKARALHQILETAPRLKPGTQIVLVTDMDHAELDARGIQELLRNDMLNSALYTLYQEGAPEVAYFCQGDKCGDFSGEMTIFDAAASDLLGRTLVFALHEDLSLELIEDPATYLGLETDVAYDASALYEAEAPLRPRASTMLGAALRD